MVRIPGHLEDGASLVAGGAGRRDPEDGQLLCGWPSESGRHTRRNLQHSALQGDVSDLVGSEAFVFLRDCARNGLFHLLLTALTVIRTDRVGRDSSVDIATRYGLTAWGSNPGVGEIFRIRPNRSWGPPSLLYNGYQVFPGVKGPGRGINHPPHLAPRLREE